jgi:DNA ligase-4
VSSLICAVLDDRRNILEDDELKYRTFVRVGSGFSFSDYAEIRARPWKEYPGGRRPSFTIGSEKGGDDKGDVYLEPEQYDALYTCGP